MSGPDDALRSRRWLEEQLAQLANLRNASPRDPSFKHWRQHTLTVLQRIWPRHASRSERFRRIAFSPASARTDGQTLRDWFARGCAEAAECLHALLVEIDTVGVPEPGEASGSAPFADAGHEDDFPVLELPAGQAGRTPDTGDVGENMRDLGGTAAALAPEESVAAEADPAAPVPPRLKVELKRPTDSAPPPVAAPVAAGMPVAPPRAPAPPDAASRPPVAPPPASVSASSAAAPPAGKPATRTARARKPATATKTRLKEMLGLNDMGHAQSRAATPAPPAATRPATSVPAASAPAPAPTPAPLAGPAPASAPPLAPTAPAAANAAKAAPPAAPAPTAAVPASGRANSLDADAFGRASDDLLANSPLFALQGKPVLRTSDATEFIDPDAVALATLAADLGRLGVPEAPRPELRAALLAVAAQIETAKPVWVTMQALVSAAMAHPELARRLMPILLPWLPRAA